MSDPQSIFFEAFDGLERLAPGSEASTLRALALARRCAEPQRILDLGCGSGAQTMVLLGSTAAEIVAVDTYEPYLRALDARAAQEGFAGRVKTLEASIGALDSQIAPGTIDLIWAEGSIYTIGFDAGLASWRGLLRNGGILACTELTWLTPEPSEAARHFWSEGYPVMRSIEMNMDAASAAGYANIGHFVLPASDWLEAYYGPLGRRLAGLREKYADDAESGGVLAAIQAEIDLYRDHGSEYGYVFYILRKADV